MIKKYNAKVPKIKNFLNIFKYIIHSLLNFFLIECSINWTGHYLFFVFNTIKYIIYTYINILVYYILVYKYIIIYTIYIINN